MAQNDYQHIGARGAPENQTIQNMPTNTAPTTSSEEELLADVDEPPDLERTPRPSGLKLHESFKASFSKAAPRLDRKESLLTNALHSNNTSPVEEQPSTKGLNRGLSCVSTWSNNSASTAELTSDGGFTSPGTRASTPSPPLPSSTFHRMVPIFTKKPFDQPISIIRHEDDNVGPLQKPLPTPSPGELNVEAGLGRKRCITFACGRKDEKKSTPEQPKPAPSPQQSTEPPKRVCTIKFACPTKISTDAPSNKPRLPRAASPAPQLHRVRASPKPSPKGHRDSDSTVRNHSPVSVRKQSATDRSRRLSTNSDLARCEAYRFHEFASSEEEVEEWTQESTCHRSRLTIRDTLNKENKLRQLGEEAEEEALEDEEEEDLEDDVDADLDDLDDDDDDDILDEDDEDDEDNHSDISDEGFQTDDEEGFAGSDDDSDAGSDYNWWTPAGPSTAATSIEHLEHIRPISRRSVSESSIGSAESDNGFKMPERTSKRKKSRPVNIRVPSPELPDSTDFVCGTLDEDRPLEAAYMSCLERRRAAKHKVTPQDIDPTFPTSDPEMDEEDENEEPDHIVSESDQYPMMHGQMDPLDGDSRGRRRSFTKTRSPVPSPKRLRSPPPAKRTVHRSPPPRKLFGHSPQRLRSPGPPPARLRSPPPIRRGSQNLLLPQQRAALSLRFAGLAERPVLTTSSSLPRTPISQNPPEYDDEDEVTCNELTVRRAIDIKVGLEKKRQRRKEQLYKRQHRRSGKEKDKRPPPGKGAERMREMGLGLAAHKGKVTGLAFNGPPTPDQKDMHVLSV